MLRAVILTLSTGILATLTGCAPSPDAQRQIAMREGQLARTADIFVDQERRRSANLAWLEERVRREQADAEMRRRYNAELARKLWERDLQQVEEWDSPDGRRMFDQLLGSRPENIEPTAIRLFY